MKTDVEIAQEAQMQHIREIAAKLGLTEDDIELYGKYKAKISLDAWNKVKNGPDGKLVLVTAINPTPAGEGKTTTSVGLADAFHKLGHKVAVALREPSLGPCFGLKGGAAGGGYAQVVPMEDINLHFTGDFHAITTAHNLLAAVIDNHIQQGNALDIDVRRVAWKRVLDLNDRALRNVVIGLGGKAHGVPRETGFDITVASEMMAILCLASDLEDMKKRLGKIVVAYSRDGRAIRAEELNVTGALTLLFKDAIKPNLVQTLEGTPALIHGGPFANIAHGCNSVMATKFALKFADIAITEAGFGADLGAEKFLDIKCRFAGIHPDAVVIVATVRALKMHGGVPKTELGKVDMAALEKGLANLTKHIENVHKFGLPAVVAINAFPTDTKEELDFVEEKCNALGASVALSQVWAKGGEGGVELASMEYIIRDHDRALFEKKKENFQDAAAYMNRKYGEGSVELDLTDSYYNMKEQFEGRMEIITNATEAMKTLGITPVIDAIRGGTDGARLSYMGLPCPNLFTGGHNGHGRFEYAVLEEMELLPPLMLEILRRATAE